MVKKKINNNCSYKNDDVAVFKFFKTWQDEQIPYFLNMCVIIPPLQYYNDVNLSNTLGTARRYFIISLTKNPLTHPVRNVVVVSVLRYVSYSKFVTLYSHTH